MRSCGKRAEWKKKSSCHCREAFDDDDARVFDDGDPGAPQDGAELRPPRSLVGREAPLGRQVFGSDVVSAGAAVDQGPDAGAVLAGLVGVADLLDPGPRFVLPLGYGGQFVDVEIGRIEIGRTGQSL